MIAWHALELQVLTDQLTPQGCRVLAPVAIGEQPLEIDAVVQSARMFERQKRSPWLFVHLLRKHTVLEIKSVAESFNVWKYQKLLGYSHLYQWKKEVWEEDLAAIALVTHVPEQLLAERKWKRLGQGFYQQKHGFLVSLIAVNELPIRQEYYALLLLASGKQRERYLQAILQEGDVYYLRYALLAYPKEVEKMSEELNLTLPWSLEENLRYLIEKGFFPPEEIVKHLSPEERLRGLNVEERLRGLEAGDIVKHLDSKEKLRGLSAEERRKLKQLLENLD